MKATTFLIFVSSPLSLLLLLVVVTAAAVTTGEIILVQYNGNRTLIEQQQEQPPLSKSEEVIIRHNTTTSLYEIDNNNKFQYIRSFDDSLLIGGLNALYKIIYNDGNWAMVSYLDWTVTENDTDQCIKENHPASECHNFIRNVLFAEELPSSNDRTIALCGTYAYEPNILIFDEDTLKRGNSFSFVDTGVLDIHCSGNPNDYNSRWHNNTFAKSISNGAYITINEPRYYLHILLTKKYNIHFSLYKKETNKIEILKIIEDPLKYNNRDKMSIDLNYRRTYAMMGINTDKYLTKYTYMLFRYNANGWW